MPPGDAAHISVTVEPVTVATKLLGADGGAITSRAPILAAKGGQVLGTGTGLHASLVAALPKMELPAADLARQLHDRTTPSSA